MEEWISLNEYAKRYKMNPNSVKQLIAKGEVLAKKLDSGYYKIKVGGDTVSRHIYEEEKKKRIQAETKLELLKKILIEKEVV